MHRVLFVMVIGAALACGGAERAGWQGEVVMLENGVELVSNPAQGWWTTATAWRLEDDLVLGSIDGDDPASFAEVVDIEIDQWDRIYVMDRQYLEIRVFEPDGSYLRTIGREGGGPGEFRTPHGMSFGPAHRLWVTDARNPVYSVFDTAGNFQTSYRRETTRRGYLWPGGWVDGSGLWDYTGVQVGDERVGALVRFDTAMVEFVDTLLVPQFRPEFYELSFDGGSMSFLVPYTARQQYRLDRGGRLVVGVSEDYRFYEVSMTGDTLRAIEREYEPVPVTSADRDAMIAEYELPQGAKVDWSRIPDQKPAFDKIDVDDQGNLWIRVPKGYGDPTTSFDIFDGDGRFLGTLTTDYNVSLFMPVLVVREHLYFVHTDELDVPYVVRLRIVAHTP